MGKSVRYSELSSLSRYHGATELNFIATISLREKCPYSEFFWSVFSRIRTESGEMPQKQSTGGIL